MKNFVKTLVIFISAAVLVTAFMGCSEPNPPPQKAKPENIAVKDSHGAELTSLTLALNGTENLTVSAGKATDYWWEITSGADVIGISDEDGATTTITAKKIGSAKIKAYAGNKDGAISKEISVTVQAEVLKLVISKVFVDGEEVTTEDTIKIIEGEHAALTFEIKDDKGAAVTGANVTLASNKTTVATVLGLQVNGIAEGDAVITITASKNGYTSAEAVTRNVSVTSAAGQLLLDVTSGSTGTWDGDTLTIFDDASLTLSVTGKVDGAAVTLTSKEWEVTSGTDVVTINSSTGVVTILKKGTATIKVDAEAAEADDPAHKTITLVVTQKGVDPNILFEWDLAAYPFETAVTAWGKTISTVSGGSPGAVGDKCLPITAGGGVSLPAYPNITLRSYGTELPYNSYTGNKGFRLGGYTNAGGPRFVIGQSANQATATGDTAATNLGGQLDLSQKKVKVTVGYADIVDDDSGNNRYQLRIAINNNTGTAANSNLGNTSSVGRSTVAQFIWNKTSTDDSIVIETNAAAGSDNVKQGSTKTAGELYAIIDPTAFASNVNKAALQNAFIMLHAQNTNAATSYGFDQGNWITITYIKIEYVGEAVVSGPVSLTVKEGSTTIANNGNIDIDEDASPITLTATVDPADATVSWAITSGGTFIDLTPSSDGFSAEIEPKAAGSATVTVTAEKSGHYTTIQNFTVNVNSTAPVVNPIFNVKTGTANGTTAWNSNQLTMTATAGGITQTDQEFNFVYLPIPAGDFTMTVKLSTASGGGNSNNARMGLIAVRKSQTTGSGNTLSVTTDNTLLFSGVGVRAPAGTTNAPALLPQRRTATGSSGVGTAYWTGTSGSGVTCLPVLLKLSRSGNNGVVTVSLDNGVTWQTNETHNNVFVASEDCYAGLFVSYGTNQVTAVFSDFRIAVGNANATNPTDFQDLDAFLEEKF
ncbi:MAG: hypothetical protein LBH20_01465 [Treponema sp.]|jgi:hypothetical protein|nr:hypothetical protein [Treponema sp.]